MAPTVCFALSFELRANSDVVGELQTALSKRGDKLWDVARRFDIGYQAMVDANPRVSPDKKLLSGTKLAIPSQFILPPGPREGIVINLAELRLYFYPPEESKVVTLPIGIGRDGNWQTPLGITKITVKHKNPYWRPTDNVRAEAAKNGTPIPRVFPPGPDNPLGKHSLRLSWPTYLIHGTNRPEGVGSRVSAGCIRMLPEDIETLFEAVNVGTQVRVIDEPFKVGISDKFLYFESHPPLEETSARYQDNFALIVSLVQKKLAKQTAVVRWSLVNKLSLEYSHTPIAIGAI